MSIEHKRRILELLDEALEVPSGEQRAAYLEAHCEDEATRREVEEMLGTEPHNAVLEAPAFDVHAEDAAVGRRVGSYEIVRLIDRGGMGSIYLAEREDFDQQVALKLLRRGLDLDDTLVRRFQNERQILAHLDHPNIAKLLDGGTTEDRLPYFVMELVDGVPIDRYCRQQDLSIRERLRLFQKVCSAVQFAHRNLVVHRDLKPNNVLITSDGEPKLLDFGIAKLLDDGMAAMTLDTAPGHGAMTPRYASPEQIRLEPVTTASDVYSLGVLLYELLTGRTPYRLASDRSDEVARAVCEQEPDKPSTAVRRQAEETSGETLHDPRRLRQLLAGDLDSIVLKALRKRPEMRYGSVEQLSEDIHRYLSGLPVDAREGTGFYRFGKFVRRNKLLLTVTAAFLVLSLGLGAVSLQLRREAAETAEALKRADFQSQLANKISILLEEVLRVAKPDESQGPRPTALELAHQAKDRIDSTLSDDSQESRDPSQKTEIEIELRGILGELFLDLGDLDEASKQMERALQLAREVYGNDHPEVAKRLGNLGVALNGLERYDKAEELQRKALEIRLRHGQEGSELFKIRGNLATTLMYLGKYEESERLFLANLNSRIRLYASVNPFDMDIARSHHNLGAFYFETENLDKAELHLREALTMRREAYGAGHTAVAATLGLLGRVVAARGDVPTAEKLYDEALRIRRKRLGDDHPDVGRTLTNLAALKIDTELDQAQDLIDQAIVILHESQEEGAEGRELAEARSVLGEILSHRDRFEEAEQYLLHSYRRLLDLRGPNAVPTRQARQRIHDHYQRWSRPDEWDRFEKQEAAQGSETSSPNP